MKKFFKHAVYFFVAAAMAAPLASCEDDENETLSEKWDLSGVTITANADKTLTFDGVVKSDKKVTSFYLTNSANEQIDLVAEKSSKSVEGTDKKWTTTIHAVIPVDVYTLTADARFTKEQTITFGETFEAILGNSNSKLGSYYNLTSGDVYTSSMVKSGELGAGAIHVIDQDDEIAYGTNAKIYNNPENSDAVKAQFAKVFIGDGYVVTPDGTIANITEKSVKDNDMTIKGVKITASNAKGCAIDISAVEGEMKSLSIED